MSAPVDPPAPGATGTPPGHTKRKSGGKRRVEQKSRTAAAEERRHRAYKKAWEAKYKALGAPPTKPALMHEYFAKIAGLAVQESALDFALPPETRRRNLIQAIKWAVDTIKGFTLADELRELYDALKAGQDAASLPKGDAGLLPPPSSR